MSEMVALEMEMPERCMDCPLNTSSMTCAVTGHQTFDDIMRPRWCPLHKMEVDREGQTWISKDWRE